MKINISNVPKAVLYFLAGTFITYILSKFITEVLDVFSNMNLIDFSGQEKIIWVGFVIISLMMTLGYSVWTLFDNEK